MENTLASEIEELASLQFTEEEIKTITGLDELNLTAMNRGRLKAMAEVRKSIFSQAKQGSSPAQKEYMALIKSREMQERRDQAKKEKENKK